MLAFHTSTDKCGHGSTPENCFSPGSIRTDKSIFKLDKGEKQCWHPKTGALSMSTIDFGMLPFANSLTMGSTFSFEDDKNDSGAFNGW